MTRKEEVVLVFLTSALIRSALSAVAVQRRGLVGTYFYLTTILKRPRRGEKRLKDRSIDRFDSTV